MQLAAPHQAPGDVGRLQRRAVLTQRNEINRLAPSYRFLGTAGSYHLADYGRQYGRRVLSADQVEALEGLIDEVEQLTPEAKREPEMPPPPDRDTRAG